MYCITRKDMKFGQYFIPARTKARVVNTPTSRNGNAPGLHLVIAVDLFDMYPNKSKGVPLSRVEINDELQKKPYGRTTSTMRGIVIYTNGAQVFLDAGDRFYQDAALYKWQLEKIFTTIPEGIEKADYSKDYSLASVVEYLKEEFAEWVQNNCQFHVLTKQEIQDGEGFDGAEPGDRILSFKGMEQFEQKQLVYQNRLEVTGFTYEFKGGLIWE